MDKAKVLKKLKKQYSNLEKSIRDKKKKKLRKEIERLRRKKIVRLKDIIQKKKVNILARIEDKIPSNFVKNKKKINQSFIGKGGI